MLFGVVEDRPYNMLQKYCIACNTDKARYCVNMRSSDTARRESHDINAAGRIERGIRNSDDFLRTAQITVNAAIFLHENGIIITIISLPASL